MQLLSVFVFVCVCVLCIFVYVFVYFCVCACDMCLWVLEWGRKVEKLGKILVVFFLEGGELGRSNFL